MPVRSTPQIRIKMRQGDEDFFLLFRPPSNAQLTSFRDNRFELQRKKGVKSQRGATLLDFGKEHLIEVENCAYETIDGKLKTLNSKVTLTNDDQKALTGYYQREIKDWKDLVDPQWIIDAASEAFEEKDAEEDIKNS